MKNSKIIVEAFFYALGVLIYVAFVVSIMVNGEAWFGQAKNFLGPLMFLMLFVVSALVTSGLVFGRPVYLYFEGRKQEAVSLFFYTGGWLLVMTIIIFIVGAFVR